jgi:hypothetical protein
MAGKIMSKQDKDMDAKDEADVRLAQARDLCREAERRLRHSDVAPVEGMADLDVRSPGETQSIRKRAKQPDFRADWFAFGDSLGVSRVLGVVGDSCPNGDVGSNLSNSCGLLKL